MFSLRRIAAVVALTGLMAAATARADPVSDPAGQTHCMALAQVFGAKSDGLIEKNRNLVTAFPNPDADAASIIARSTKLQAQLAQIAESLTSVYGGAAAASRAETDALAPLPLKDLVVQAQACLT